MEATLNDVVQRLERLENEVRALRENVRLLDDEEAWPDRPLTMAEQGRLMMVRARRNAARESRMLSKIFDEMGITGPPVSREEARRRYREEGHDPEATDFAQGIADMREE
ncbi:hypothetical protein HUU05_11355 [candidate division KSB1 bacterium]|nr:hypothetical protein [candidate division KSB1 bacterium]